MSADIPSTAKPLPKNRAVLETMLKHCDECLQMADRVRHRNEQKLKLFGELSDDKISVEELKRRKRDIEELQARERDNYIPAAEELWPYGDPKLLSDMTAFLAAGELAGCNSTDAVTLDAKQADTIAKAAIAMITGQRLHVVLLDRLRQSIFEALESKGADTGADLATFLAKVAPHNQDIASLYLRIAREHGDGISETQIALEFTDGDRKQAAHLLRGVRRYRERLAKWNN